MSDRLGPERRSESLQAEAISKRQKPNTALTMNFFSSDSRLGFHTAILDRLSRGHDEISQSTARPASVSVRKRARPRVKKRRRTADRGFATPSGRGLPHTLPRRSRSAPRASGVPVARSTLEVRDRRARFASRVASANPVRGLKRSRESRGVLFPAAASLARHVRPDVGESDGACAFPARRDVSAAFGERPRLAPPPASLPPVPLLRRASEGAADARGC